MEPYPLLSGREAGRAWAQLPEATEALGHVESSVSEVKPKAPALSGRLTLSHERRPKLPLLKEHKVVHRRIRVPLFRCGNMGDTRTHSTEQAIWVTPSQRG